MPKFVVWVGKFLASLFVLGVLAMNHFVQGYLGHFLNDSGVHTSMALLYAASAGILIFYWQRKMLPDRLILLVFAFGSVLFALREIYLAIQ